MADYSLLDRNGSLVCDLSDVVIDQEDKKVSSRAPINQAPTPPQFLRRNSDGKRVPIIISGFSADASGSRFSADVMVR